MNNIVKVISTSVTEGLRQIKFLLMGRSDVQEVPQVAPFGIDSNPIKDSIAVYSKTLQDGEAVIIGYIPKISLAELGELRLYSTDSNGAEKTYTLLKNDGNIEINGNTDNMVRHSNLSTSFINYSSNVGTELGKIAAAINAIAPGSYTPVVPSIDISTAKIDNVKTN